MADFNYKFNSTSTVGTIAKFDKLYAHNMSITPGLDLFYNDNTTTHICDQAASITILGYAYKANNDLNTYLTDLLHNFSQSRIVEAKRELLGQYIAIVHTGGKIYIFSDFLQTRDIFYNTKQQRVCSCLAAMTPSVTDNYKAFEFLAMRHCVYPAWLGNTTIDEQIKRVCAYQYLKIDNHSGSIEVADINILIDNSKTMSLRQIKSHTLSILRNTIRHPMMRDKKVCSTITGGFDSRLVTALINEYYHDSHLRISTYKGGEQSRDYTIASRVAEVLGQPLDNYQTDKKAQKEDFYSLTDGLTPQENLIMTQMLNHADNWDLGFGGVYGTELYTTFANDTIDNLIAEYSATVRKAVKAESSYYTRFEQALRDEFENLSNHYNLKFHDNKDLMRIFRLLNTAHFSSGVISAFNIRGNQFEIFGTFPVVEAGLQIPYKYMGSRVTFGRFYMIPKSITEHINLKISKIETTHFCPMRPMSIFSFMSYVAGKIKGRQYYRQQAAKGKGKGKDKGNIAQLSYITDKIAYTSNEWFEGFMQRYLSDSK